MEDLILIFKRLLEDTSSEFYGMAKEAGLVTIQQDFEEM